MVDYTGKVRAGVLGGLSLSESLRDSCIKAGVVVLPDQVSSDGAHMFFPENMTAFIHFLKDAELDVEIAASDEQFREKAEHAEPVSLGILLLTHFTLPIVTSVISGYIINRIMVRRELPPTRLKIISERPDGSINTFEFDGSPEILVQTLDQISKTGSLPERRQLPEHENDDQ